MLSSVIYFCFFGLAAILALVNFFLIIAFSKASDAPKTFQIEAVTLSTLAVAACILLLTFPFTFFFSSFELVVRPFDPYTVVVAPLIVGFLCGIFAGSRVRSIKYPRWYSNKILWIIGSGLWFEFCAMIAVFISYNWFDSDREGNGMAVVIGALVATLLLAALVEMKVYRLRREKKKEKNNFDRAIESIKRGDWDTAHELLRDGMLSLTNMDLAQRGNYIMTLAILDGAAGNTNSALNSVRTALKMCPQGSPNARLLNLLGHRIDNPPDTYKEAPVKMGGRPVDFFYYLIAQITVNIVELGEIGSDELVDQLNRAMSDEYIRMQERKKG